MHQCRHFIKEVTILNIATLQTISEKKKSKKKRVQFFATKRNISEGFECTKPKQSMISSCYKTDPVLIPKGAPNITETQC